MIFVYTFTFCLTMPVDKKGKIFIFTQSAPRVIQSNNRNVHNNDGDLKHLWLSLNRLWGTSVQI